MRLTFQSDAMPPRCASASRRKPSTTWPTSSEAGAMLPSVRTAEATRHALWQAGGAHLRGCRRMVVRDAMERQRLRFGVEHRVARGGVAVARLAGRAGDGEPAPLRR